MSRMDAFHVFRCDTVPPAVRYVGQFLGTSRGKDGRLRPDFEPILFRGATEDQVRARASAWWAEIVAENAEAEKRRADRAAAARLRRERHQQPEEIST